MISFADALTDLSHAGGGHPAHAAMLLAGALAARRGSLPPVTEPDAWGLTEEEVMRARNLLTKPSVLPPYLPASAPQAEPLHAQARHVLPGDQLYCQGDMLSGHHKPGWCRVEDLGAARPGFGMGCGRRWTPNDAEETLLVSRQLAEARAS